MTKEYDFHLVNCDTDSITVCDKNGRLFTEEENLKLIEELNSLYPDGIIFEDDGVFSKIIVVKAKNYVLDNGKKVKYKGSSLTDTKKEPILIELLNRMIDLILNDATKEQLVDLYHEYIIEAFNVTDVKKWAVKKTITKAVLEGKRLNEVKVRDAIGDRTYQEGDKIWIYPVIDGNIQVVAKGEPQFKKDGSPKLKENQILRLVEDWDGNIDSMHLVKRVHATVCILENVIDKKLFLNYNIKRNHKMLWQLLGREAA